MSEQFSWGLQKAIYEKLSNSPGLQAVLGSPPRIYDAPPEQTAFPFLIIGESREKDWPGVDGGLEHDVRIYVQSKYQGHLEIKNVQNEIYDALHEVDLTIEGRRLVHIRFTFSDSFPRGDKGTYQGVSRFRAVTQPLSGV